MGQGERMILLHSWRTIGLGFLFLHFQGQLGGLFAYVAGLGDAIAAVTATLLALALLQQPERVRSSSIWRWNTFGLLDFVLAVSLGVLGRSGQTLQFGELNTDMMGTFPIVLIPVFAVPLLAITHIIIYMQLRLMPKDS